MIIRGAGVRSGQPSPFEPWLRLLLGAMGAASFGGGVAAVFITANGTGAAVLLTFGGILMVLALLGDRIESFEFGGTRLRLRVAAEGRLAAAEELERRGDTRAATQLRAEAQALLEAAGPIASEYRATRHAMRAGAARTSAMRRIVADAEQLAVEQTFEPAEVIGWLREGSEEERITALAMMHASPALRHFDAILEAIQDSRSAFEQYHAMLVAEQMLRDLSPEQSRRLAETIRGQRGLRFRHDSDRWRLSERILGQLAVKSGGR